MSTITARLVSRFDRWLDRKLASDDRYICAACDDRFTSRSQGIAHVLHSHPEYQGVVVYEGVAPLQPTTQVARPAASRPVGLNPAPVRVPVHALR
jgi:hypothetical protein